MYGEGFSWGSDGLGIYEGHKLCYGGGDGQCSVKGQGDGSGVGSGEGDRKSVV